VYSILSRRSLASQIVQFWVAAPAVAARSRPGQFVIVRLHERSERIPLTIVDADPSLGAISLIVQGIGKTTMALNAMQEGDRILDIAGPLGRPMSIQPARHVCCVAGGVGAAVVLPIARAFKEAGGRITIVVGARTRDLVVLEDEFRAIADATIVATDDGSYGARGQVTAALRDVIESEPRPFDEVIAAGPVLMMKAVCALTRSAGISTRVSLNPIMVDGTGMCGGCRVTVAEEQKFACVDGPEFDGHDVDFDELAARLGAYRESERLALEYALRDAETAACGATTDTSRR
jgi:ferredoxin/flavodoxin---NADP+ reductase